MALLTAVMVVAFAATVGATMMVQQNIAVHRAANLIAQDQAWWYVIGMEEWAATLLDRDREDNQFDHLEELWAQPIDFLPVDEGGLSGRLLDLQGRFNLHSLIDAQGQPQQEAQEQLTRLLQHIEAVPPGQAQSLAVAISDWLDADTIPGFPGGAEDDVYLGKPQPYRAANRKMASLSELMLIEGIDQKIYAAIQPHLCIRPDGRTINVNTATAPVLISLSSKMTPAEAEAIIAQRVETPYEKPEDFLSDTLVAEMDITAEQITTQSEYFMAQGSANIGRIRLQFVSLLERPRNGPTRVLAHSRNAL